MKFHGLNGLTAAWLAAFLITADRAAAAGKKPAAAEDIASRRANVNAPRSPAEQAAHAARIAWWRDAKFGLFIHWGLYALPAGEWQGQPVAGIGEWIMNRAKIPVKEYEQLARQFNPVKFNAEAWVRMAADAGMKYLVITSKHHDGFAMYGSKASRYNIVDATPFHRDPLQELAAACARHGLRLGFYYSQAQDWHEPNGVGNTWDFGPDARKDFGQYLRDKAEPQVRELLTGYGPLGLIWFDTPRQMTPERAARFVRLVRTLQPDCLIDGRLGPGSGDYLSMGDNRIPPAVVPGDWEVPATLNHTWGFKKDDTDWKPPAELTFKLVDIVSKGGNYLLNVGPTAEGAIPQPCQDHLRRVGRWLKTNGAAIYGARPTPFGTEFGGPTTEARDWRCTAKPGQLYFTLFKWPAGLFELPAMKARVRQAWLLADPAHTPLQLDQTGGRTAVHLPAQPPDDIASVIAVALADGPP